MTNRLNILHETVRSWLEVKDQKRAAMGEYNEQLKHLEETIAGLSSRIEEDKYQMELPLEGEGGDE